MCIGDERGLPLLSLIPMSMGGGRSYSRIRRGAYLLRIGERISILGINPACGILRIMHRDSYSHSPPHTSGVDNQERCV